MFKDAGRAFWRRLRKVTNDCSLVESFVCKACYSFATQGFCHIAVAIHVDDFIWACIPEPEDKILKFKSFRTFGIEEPGSFFFYGRSLSRIPEEVNIKITCRSTTGRVSCANLEDVSRHESESL